MTSDSASPGTDVPSDGKNPLGEFNMITSVEDIGQVLPKYAGVTTMPPSGVGMGDTQPDWENDSYEFQPAAIVARILTEIENCVLVIDECGVFDSVSEVNPSPFGGVLVGECVDYEFEQETIHLTVKNVQYITVLYASGLLLTRYEKELATRVLNNASEPLIDSVNRKYRKKKRDLQRKIGSTGFTTPISVSDSTIDVYGVQLQSFEQENMFS